MVKENDAEQPEERKPLREKGVVLSSPEGAELSQSEEAPSPAREPSLPRE